MSDDDGVNQCQAETGTASVSASCLVQAAEPFEDGLALIDRNAVTVVFDAEFGIRVP